MIYAPDFEARTLDIVRRATDDIEECARAKIQIAWNGQAPTVEFVFGFERSRQGCPFLGIQLVAESRKNPLAPGRLLEGDELRRHVRGSVEQYLKLNGIQITRKTIQHACL